MTKKEINEKAIQLLIEDIEEANPDSEIDFAWHIETLDIDFERLTLSNIEDEVIDVLNESRAFELEFVYYSDAMDYLRESDASLQKAMGIAEDWGYKLGNVNSPLLATLLLSEEERENFVFDFPSYGYIRDRFDELIDQE